MIERRLRRRNPSSGAGSEAAEQPPSKRDARRGPSRPPSTYYSCPSSSSAATAGAISRARWSSSASVRFAMGCLSARNRYSGTPQACAIARPVASKTSVTIDAAGMPTFSNTIPSSTLPDEHDPQSPMPATMTSTVCLASSRISLWAGTPGVVLAPHARLGGPVVALQDLADLHQQAVGVELRVLDEPDALALERVRARDVRERLLPRLDGRVEDLESCHHALLSLMRFVTASLVRRLAHPGMYAENAPARPPAATTRRSSGLARSGRMRGLVRRRRRRPRTRSVRLRCATLFCVCSKTNFRMSALLKPLSAMVRMCSPAMHQHVVRLAHHVAGDAHVVAQRREDALRACSRAGCRTGAAPRPP